MSVAFVGVCVKDTSADA